MNDREREQRPLPQHDRKTRIKFCGMRRSEDVQYAIDLGVDYIGFVVVADRPRSINADQVQHTQQEVDCTGVCRVGVFDDQPADRINRLAEILHLDLVQLHGTESLALCARIAVPVIAMIPVPTVGSQHPPRELPGDLLAQPNLYAVLLDSSLPDGRSGGLGSRADPRTLSALRQKIPPQHRVVLAGGLTAENVGAIVDAYHPDVVDVSSGIESTPGTKDAERMRAFVDAVRRGKA